MSKCEWFLSDGTLLKGKDAEEYLNDLLQRYNGYSKSIDGIYNHFLENKKYDNDCTLVNKVLKYSEALSFLHLEMEILIGEMKHFY